MMITPQTSWITMIITHINEKAGVLHSYYHLIQLRVKSSTYRFSFSDSKSIKNSWNVMDAIIFNKTLSI